MDERPALGNFSLLAELVGEGLPLFPVSTESGEGLEDLRRALFAALHVIRVYTKAPGKPAEKPAPYVLKSGSTVLDAARAVHADFQENLKFARIWGEDFYDGQMVGRDDVLSDKDLLELHV
jgi:ribosome-interacting GTPase 1